MTSSPDDPITTPIPERRCGRCQCALPVDSTLPVQTDWALCAPCRAILLPSR